MEQKRNEYFIDTITSPNEVIISRTNEKGIIIFEHLKNAKIEKKCEMTLGFSVV